jgi:peptidyl-prolyl cis-trans isomerase C
MSEIAITHDPIVVDVSSGRLGGLRSFLWRAIREPFLHFLLIGALLFAVNEYLEERAKFTRIAITQDIVRGIAANYRLQYGVTPTGPQLDKLVDEYVREEVFYHQALKLGLDRDDEIIRRRLVQKYEFLQQDLALEHDPGRDELRAFYTQHQGDYRTPERVSFTQVYFSPDLRGEHGARADALRVSTALKKRDVTRAVEEGDRFPGPTDYAATSGEELSRVFGKEGLAADVFGVAPNQWSEPLHSGLGWHVVFVSERRPAQLATFEQAEDTVRRDYIEAVRSRRNAQIYEKLQRGFVIVRE